jgi:fibronectin type 3 domain-containing protein
VIGYNTYVSSVSGGPYVKLDASPVGATDYIDTLVHSGQTRYYVVTAVDASNQESTYSNEVAVVLP